MILEENFCIGKETLTDIGLSCFMIQVILATKVCGYSEKSSYLRDSAKALRVDAANIKESVEKSLKRLNTDYIDLLQIHWPDRYVSLFGEFFYDPSKWRPSVPFVEQLKAFQELINEGKVRYIGVSNETSYGVMEFVHAAKVEGLPKIVSIQNSYSLLVRCKFERGNRTLYPVSQETWPYPCSARTWICSGPSICNQFDHWCNFC
uniref:NADP-dependent oxidoreductase domain-containing protein n=1 Tax=Nelumbo nucifera TaxID=4432 RepID=A0A822XR05_NELNU|nr:TPA_asm: hypothetical protein HUJ06_021371 [Nelumbo nucifera]